MPRTKNLIVATFLVLSVISVVVASQLNNSQSTSASAQDAGMAGLSQDGIVNPTDAPGSETVAYVNPVGTVGNQCHRGSLGMDFDVVSPIKITSLGAFDDEMNGFKDPITVYIADRNSRYEYARVVLQNNPDELSIDNSKFVKLPQPILLDPQNATGGIKLTVVAYGYGGYTGDLRSKPSRNWLGCNERNGNSEGRPPTWYTQTGGDAIKFTGKSRFAWDIKFPAIIDTGPANRYAAGTFIFEPAY